MGQTSILTGACRDSSHTAEGPIGSDLTKRQSRFDCDSAILTLFGDNTSHVMIQFAQKASRNTRILGFAGQVEADGIMVQVDHAYFQRGQATVVDDGWCKLFKDDKDQQITDITCGMKRDKAGRRTTAVVEFHASPGAEKQLAASRSSERVIGSPDETWKKVQSDGREIYVRTNGFYAGKTFRTFVVTNLPESTIVGAPQSVMNEVEGNCSTQQFHVLGSLFFAGKNRSGAATNSLPAENVERKLVPNSPFAKAFDMLCKIASEPSRP